MLSDTSPDRRPIVLFVLFGDHPASGYCAIVTAHAGFAGSPSPGATLVVDDLHPVRRDVVGWGS
jgi:hypothetical protein